MSSGLVLRWFRRVWSGHPVVAVALVLFTLLNAILVTAFPWLWQHLIDSVYEDGGPARIRELATWMLIVGLGQSIFYLLLQGLRSVMNVRIQWLVRRRVFDHLSQLSPAFYRRWRAGDVVTRLTDDAGEKTSWFLSSGVFRAGEAALVVLACLAAMLSIDPILTLWVVLPLPLLIVAQAFAQGALGRRYAEVQKAISGINDELTTTFAGIRIVQACGLEGSAAARFSAQAKEQQRAEVRTAVVQQAIFLMYGYGWQTAVFALLLAGGWHVLDGQITLGQFVSFEGFVMTLVWPMFDFGTFLSRFKQAEVALRRLEDLLEEEAPQSTGSAAHGTGLELSGASVLAEDGHRLLDDVDLQVGPGELCAVVGEVASGKTTLLQLMAGHREPSAGSMRFDGLAASEIDSAALRTGVGYVPQDPVLISTSLRDNLLLGREVDEETLARALDVSRFAQDLPSLPDGLDTTVGERGVTLSGGQQQRVALARALVGAPTLLLLDDATSALDADTEAAFWDRLEQVLPDLAAIVVTHRPATLQRANRIVVLDEGRVAQVGRHDELLALDGPYRRIYGGAEARNSLAALG